MRLSDAQLLTAAIAIIFPVSMLIYSNIRITDAKEVLRAEIQTARLELLIEIQAVRQEIKALGEKIDRATSAIENTVETHILEYYK